MDLPCPEWTQHVEQKWTELGSAGRASFSSSKDLTEMFHFAQCHVLQEDIHDLSTISERYSVKKSAECASRFREQGNLKFKNKDYTAAALHYSKGVCHAGKGTEQLSLCYANRSAALFHLGLYSECMEDIRRAFDEGYPSNLQSKLVDRRAQCMNWLKKQEESKSFSKHQKPQTAEKKDDITGLSAGVSVCFTTEKGRHLLATENKSAGEVVIEDKPFSFVLVPGNGHHTTTKKACLFGTEHRYCHHCMFKTLSTVPCLGCSYAQYCGQRCASEAWRQYHQWECPAGSELLALGVLAHLALRVAVKAGLKEVQKARESYSNTTIDVPEAVSVSSDRNNGKSNFCGESLYCVDDLLSGGSSRCSECSEHSNCYQGKSYLSIYSLLPHVDNHSPTLRFLLAFTMAVLCQKLNKVGPLPETWQCCEQEGGSGHCGAEQIMLGTTTLRHMMQLRCNAQAVTEIRVKEGSSLAVQSSEEVRIATAVFPVLSLLNHSCRPNTSISFSVGLRSDHPDCCASGVKVSIRACKDIAAGQELLHCYGPHCSRMDLEERQRLLLEQYFFHCRCEACKLELSGQTKKHMATSQWLKCDKCGSFLQSNEVKEEVNICSQPSCDYQISNIELQKRLQILQEHLNRAIELMENSREDKALRILQEAVAQADTILMKTHPVQGELADATARVYATMGDWRQAALHLKHSLAAVRSQYGEDSVELGRQLFKLTQLHFNGKDKQSALSVIPSARRLLSLHCDPCCEELQELLEMEVCLHGAM